MEDPKLLNPEWQAALENALPQLSRYQAKLNALSADIRTVEKTLIDSGFRIYVAVRISVHEELAWMDAGANTWRIGVLRQEKNGLTFRPLIETATADRLRLSQAIPQLLAAIANEAGSGPAGLADVPLTDDEIPF